MSRAVLVAAGLLLGLAGCAAREDEVDLSAYPTGMEAREAPMLAALVAQGELPPIEERLPENPLVADHGYEGYEGPGVYGGTWHTMHMWTAAYHWMMVGGYAPLMRWKFDCTGLAPGLAESLELSEDGTVLTLHLRKGLRWSDGAPYTSADYAFYYDLCLDDRHRYSPQVWSRVNGEPMTLETPDPYTIVMKFAGPNWLAPASLAIPTFWMLHNSNVPKHYMEQFHPDYCANGPDGYDEIRLECEGTGDADALALPATERMGIATRITFG